METVFVVSGRKCEAPFKVGPSGIESLSTKILNPAVFHTRKRAESLIYQRAAHHILESFKSRKIVVAELRSHTPEEIFEWGCKQGFCDRFEGDNILYPKDSTVFKITTPRRLEELILTSTVLCSTNMVRYCPEEK